MREERLGGGQEVFAEVLPAAEREELVAQEARRPAALVGRDPGVDLGGHPPEADQGAVGLRKAGPRAAVPVFVFREAALGLALPRPELEAPQHREPPGIALPGAPGAEESSQGGEALGLRESLRGDPPLQRPEPGLDLELGAEEPRPGGVERGEGGGAMALGHQLEKRPPVPPQGVLERGQKRRRGLVEERQRQAVRRFQTRQEEPPELLSRPRPAAHRLLDLGQPEEELGALHRRVQNIGQGRIAGRVTSRRLSVSFWWTRTRTMPSRS